MRRAAAALVLASAALCGCSDDDTGEHVREVDTLEVPTPEEREANEKFAEARALAIAGNARDAEKLLRRAVELAPRHVAGVRLLADLVLERRQWDEAIVLLRRLVELAPEDLVARTKLFDALYAHRDYAASEDVALQWVKLARDSTDALFALGRAQRARGELPAAVESLQRAAVQRSSRADIRSELGLVFLDQGKPAEAERAQRDAIRRNPRYGEAWVRLAEVIASGDVSRRSEALTALRKALEQDLPRPAAARVELYRLLQLSAGDGDTERAAEAEAEWARVLALAGRDMLPWGGLGAPPPEEDGAKDREKALRDAVIANPEDVPARLELALFLHRQGDIASAIAEYEEARRSTGDARLAGAHGAALLVRGDPVAAEPRLAEAVRLDPTDETSWRNLGWALALLRKDAEAIAALDRAIALYGADRLAHRARGLARMHRGDLDEGRAEIAATGWLGR